MFSPDSRTSYSIPAGPNNVTAGGVGSGDVIPLECLNEDAIVGVAVAVVCGLDISDKAEGTCVVLEDWAETFPVYDTSDTVTIVGGVLQQLAEST